MNEQDHEILKEISREICDELRAITQKMEDLKNSIDCISVLK